MLGAVRLLLAPETLSPETQLIALKIGGFILFFAAAHGVKRGFETDPPPPEKPSIEAAPAQDDVCLLPEAQPGIENQPARQDTKIKI